MTDTPEAVAAAAEWLRECSTWMLTNDLDMKCPMETDPLSLAEDLEATRPDADLVRQLVEAQDKAARWDAWRNRERAPTSMISKI